MVIIEIPKFRGDTDLKAELDSVQWTPHHKPGTTDRREGQGKFLPVKEIVVGMKLDDNSSELFKRSVQGPVFPKVIIRFRKPGGGAGAVPYMEITMKNVQIASYHIAGGDRPVVIMALVFDEAEIKQL